MGLTKDDKKRILHQPKEETPENSRREEMPPLWIEREGMQMPEKNAILRINFNLIYFRNIVPNPNDIHNLREYEVSGLLDTGGFQMTKSPKSQSSYFPKILRFNTLFLTGLLTSFFLSLVFKDPWIPLLSFIGFSTWGWLSCY